MSGAEGLAGSCDHDATEAVIVAEAIELALQGGEQLFRQGIEPGGAVERQGCYAVAPLDQQHRLVGLAL